MNLRRAVFLDRDGVLNRAIVRLGKPYTPTRLDDFELLTGAREACDALRAAGFALVVVTNQPDVARGTQSVAVIESMHSKLRSLLPLDDIRVCFHDERSGCGCRKPLPGLLLQAATELGLDLSRSVMVGDRWNDIAAGRNAGCRAVFIDYHYSEQPPSMPDATVRSTTEAARWILENLDA